MNCQARLNHALVILTVRQRSYNAKSIRNCFLMPSLTCRTMLVALILQLVATILQIDKKGVVPPAGFEPAIYTLKGCCPGPLDDGGLRHGHYSIEPQTSEQALNLALEQRHKLLDTPEEGNIAMEDLGRRWREWRT